jgi:hypothetical protein
MVQAESTYPCAGRGELLGTESWPCPRGRAS